MQVDNSAAFDRVRWDFMDTMLEAFGFPREFRDIMKTLYKDIRFQVKVNGAISEEGEITNSCRQGCGVAPLAFVVCQEALLIMIRRDCELNP